MPRGAVIQRKQSAGVRTACAGMATHKFRVGEKVQFLAGLGVRFATSEIYEIVQ